MFIDEPQDSDMSLTVNDMRGGDLPEPATHSKIRKLTELRNLVRSHPIGDVKVPAKEKNG